MFREKGKQNEQIVLYPIPYCFAREIQKSQPVKRKKKRFQYVKPILTLDPSIRDIQIVMLGTQLKRKYGVGDRNYSDIMHIEKEIMICIPFQHEKQ